MSSTHHTNGDEVEDVIDEYGNQTDTSTDETIFPAKPAAVPSLPARIFYFTSGILFSPIRQFFFLLSWLIWLFSSITLGTGQFTIVLYSSIRITISLILYLFVLVGFKCHDLLEAIYVKCVCWSQRHIPKAEKIRLKKQALEQAVTLERWQKLALDLDQLCGHSNWKNSPASPDYDYRLLKHISNELISFRMSADYKGLIFHLTNIMNRQFCNIQSEKLYSLSYHGTKFAIEEFYCRVVEQLSFLCKTDFGPEFSIRQKLRFFQRARRTLGRTVLCLSGGGALAMYHTGVARALVKGNCLPSIINGTSGGSIIAALIGTRTDEELKDPEFFAPSLCQRYGGEYRWLPTLQQQVDQFIANRVLMDYRVFRKSAQTFFGHLTFEEAYRRTQRVLCITVTWSGRASKPHPLVLNHITSPNVFVWSAVTCSCALPGLMVPQNLFAKGPDGAVIEYYPSGSELIDGSLQADIPVQRLTELFNAQTFVVSQTNPHVIDFVRDGNEGRGEGGPSLFGRSSRIHQILSNLEKFLQADIGHRLKRLSKMRVIPKIYNQDFREVFSGQQYTGDINIVPRIPFLMRFKALTHPSIYDMHEYFRGGEQATFPKISRVQNVLLLERTLEECVRSLTRKMKHDEANRRKRPKPTASTTATSASAINDEHLNEPESDVHGSDDPSTTDSNTIPTQPTSSTATSNPTSPMRHSSSASSMHTPHRIHTGVILPDAFDSASTHFAAGRRRSFSHHTADPGLQTPTAAVLASLPLHGGGSATDHETIEDESATRTHRTNGTMVGAGASNAHSSPPDHDLTHPPRVGSSTHLSQHGGGDGYESDVSTTTTASYIDFDAEELANQELDAEEEPSITHQLSQSITTTEAPTTIAHSFNSSHATISLLPPPVADKFAATFSAATTTISTPTVSSLIS